MRRAPVRVESFYTDTGSLTAPACTEGVRWSVLANGGHVSKAAVAQFHRVIAGFPNYNGYPNDNRPVQPLNGRVIKYRHGGRPHRTWYESNGRLTSEVLCRTACVGTVSGAVDARGRGSSRHGSGRVPHF